MRNLAVYAALIAAGAWFVTFWSYASVGFVAFDLYQYWLPNMLYGAQRITAGGGGLLWNPFQDCGQPSFGIGSTALLYPLNAVFLIFDPHTAILVELAANFAIAGIGMYWLARELGVSRAAALCGALAFELGGTTIDTNTWMPLVGGAYVWMPVALLFCERLLRAPSLISVAGLGGALAVSLLSGFPQIAFFTYQMIALRLAFELATRGRSAQWRPVVAVGVGLALGPLLGAVHLLPAAETAADSVRGHALDSAEIVAAAVTLSFEGIRQSLLWRSDQFVPVLVVPLALASVSWLRPATRRRAIFYTAAAVLYCVLAYGPTTPLFSWYLKLPFGALFREPIRFMWVTCFCLSVLAAFGADAVLFDPPEPWRRAIRAMICMGLAVTAFDWLEPNRLRPMDWALIATLAAAVALATSATRRRNLAPALTIGATAANLLTFYSPKLPPFINSIATRQLTMRRLLPDESVYSTYADLFAALRQRMTPQDRVYMLHAHENYAVTPKTASLFELRSIDDYEPQPSLRWAEYLVMLRTDRDLVSLNQFYFMRTDAVAPGFRRALLNLSAARYVLADTSVPTGLEWLTPALYPLDVSPDLALELYENQQALPRAFYVPRAWVVSDPKRLLYRLAAGNDDPRSVALLEAHPPSGFLGSNDAAASGRAEFLTDEPEHVVVRVEASAAGFLHLGDQYAPGWTASVNGTPAPILQANYAFRLVEVPAGESIVEFQYHPPGLRLGATISALTAAALIISVALAHHRRQRSG